MAPAKVMLIRHAEKPDGTGNVMGVSELGLPDPRQLSVRGWQRAGALVRFFAPAGGNFADGIATPSAIFACKPYGAANSVRPFSTVTPLAALLGIAVNHQIGKHDIAALLDAVETSSGTVLICWSHKLMASILRGLAGGAAGLPDEWPAGRFDLVWVLDRAGAGWSFCEVGQLLLPGDAHPAGRRPTFGFCGNQQTKGFIAGFEAYWGRQFQKYGRSEVAPTPPPADDRCTG